MLSLGIAYYELREALRAIYDEGEASTIAHIVMEELTGLGRLERLAKKDQKLNELQELNYEELKAELSQGRPLQYVLGEAYFLGRAFKVTPAVLIPRPETEELVDWILREGSGWKVLDIGTGSGCIAASLKLGKPEWDVTGIDLSEAALEVAGINCTLLEAQVNLLQCDFLDEQSRNSLGAFDLIVSNPPYIPQSEEHTLHANVREHEPGTALFVPDNDALLFYRLIAAFGQRHLSPVGSIFCELHRDYAQQTADMFRAMGYRKVQLRQDMQGAPRMLRAQF